MTARILVGPLRVEPNLDTTMTIYITNNTTLQSTCVELCYNKKRLYLSTYTNSQFSEIL